LAREADRCQTGVVLTSISFDDVGGPFVAGPEPQGTHQRLCASSSRHDVRRGSCRDGVPSRRPWKYRKI